jgi:hypothetical protein
VDDPVFIWFPFAARPTDFSVVVPLAAIVAGMLFFCVVGFSKCEIGRLAALFTDVHLTRNLPPKNAGWSLGLGSLDSAESADDETGRLRIAPKKRFSSLDFTDSLIG